MTNSNYQYLIKNLHGYKKELSELEKRKNEITTTIEEVKTKIKKEKEMMTHFRSCLERVGDHNCTF